MGVDDRTPNVADGSAGANQKRKPGKFGFILIGLSFLMLLPLIIDLPFTSPTRFLGNLLGFILAGTIPSLVISGLLFLIFRNRLRKSFLDYFSLIFLIITIIAFAGWAYNLGLEDKLGETEENCYQEAINWSKVNHEEGPEFEAYYNCKNNTSVGE